MDVTPFLEIRPAPEAVFDRAEQHPERVRFYVRDGGDWAPLTWLQFAGQIRGVAGWLVEQGLEPGDRVAIFAANSVEWAATALAIQAAGGVMVPIYPSSAPAQAGYILRHSGARWLFVDGTTSARVREEDLESVEQVVRLDEPLPAADAALPDVELGQTAMMLYTSGTTGDPKGVPLTHENVGSSAADWLRCLAPRLDEDLTDLLWLPLSHIFGFGEMCLGNTLGFTTYMSDPARVIAELPDVAPEVFMSVPAYWEKVARPALAEAGSARIERLKERTGGRLQLCLSGGAGLKREIKELYYDAGVLIVEGYGLTECSPTLTLNRPDDFRFDSVGKPFPSVELRIADDGEIQARGPSVFAGYYRDPESTATAFTDDGWFRTGDLGRFTDDGFVQIIGRKKEILVTAGGKNVPPANVEMPFTDDPDIAQVVVYGDGKKFLVAGVWLARPIGRDEVERRVAAVNETLSSCETIKKFFIANEPLTPESGLVTASLKIRRKAIYERYRDQFEALYESGKGGRREHHAA